MTNMPSIRGVIRESLIAETVPEKAEQRRDALQQITNPTKKRVTLAIHELALRHPARLAPLVGLGRYDDTAEVVGKGGFSQVYRSGDDVLKVDIGTLGLPWQLQKDRKKELKGAFRAMKRIMPDFILPQETTIDGHPEYPRLEAVITRQPYQPDLEFLNLFTFEDDVSARAFEQFGDEPEARGQLRELVKDAWVLIDCTGLVPDLCGLDNLVLNQERQLKVIDGTPLPIRTTVGQIAVHRLGNLQAILDDPARIAS